MNEALSHFWWRSGRHLLRKPGSGRNVLSSKGKWLPPPFDGVASGPFTPEPRSRGSSGRRECDDRLGDCRWRGLLALWDPLLSRAQPVLPHFAGPRRGAVVRICLRTHRFYCRVRDCRCRIFTLLSCANAPLAEQLWANNRCGLRPQRPDCRQAAVVRTGF